MGTNYYYHSNVCQHCGKAESVRHIGKSSYGWCFSLHVYPEDGITDLVDWLPLFRTPTSEIRDEYGKIISRDKMIEIVTVRRGDSNWDALYYASWEDFLTKNHAVLGPNNLLRHKLSEFCIGHGEGTWDLIVGHS